MYIVTVKKFLATVTSYRNCNSHTLLWQIMQSPLISLTHLYTTHTTHPIYIYIFSTYLYTFDIIVEWIFLMRISSMKILFWFQQHKAQIASLVG